MCHSFSGRRTAPCKIPENFVQSAAARHSFTRPLCRQKQWPRPWPHFSIGESACSLGQNASVLSGEGNPSHSLFCYIALRHLRTPPERPAAFRRLSLLSFRRGSQAKPAEQCAGKTLRGEKAADFCLSLWRTIRDRKERSDGIAKRREASARRGSQAKPAAQSAGKTLREEKATDFCLSLWRTIRDSNPWPFGP